MGMGLMMKNFNIMGVHWKIDFLGGGGEGARKKFFFFVGGGWGVNRLKRGACIVCRFKRRLGKKEKTNGWCFWGRGLRPQCTLWVGGAFSLTQISKANNIVTQQKFEIVEWESNAGIAISLSYMITIWLWW